MSHQINIDKNGTTTLATAGKYCDRNIDVNVNVPSDDSLVNSIIDRSFAGEYVNNDVTLIGAYAFSQCKLTRVVFPNVVQIDVGAFNTCSPLEFADFSSVNSVKGIGGTAFRYCSNFATLILRNQEVARLVGINALDGTAIAAGTGYVYVPDNLVDSYKTATNWSTYASQIKPLSELGE